jgi:hypothetical protein
MPRGPIMESEVGVFLIEARVLECVVRPGLWPH